METQVYRDAKKKMGAKIACTLEALTPVHVGSGVKWQYGVDYFTDKDDEGFYTVVIPPEEFLDYIRQNPDKIPESNQEWIKVLKDATGGYDFDSCMPANREDIHAFERNGNGKWYLPGSSIKGALRSVIINALWQGKSEADKNHLLGQLQPSESWADSKIMGRMLGGNPNTNLLRLLQVFDGNINSQDIELFKLHILSLSNHEGTSFRWWRRNHNEENPQNATALYAEMLQKGSIVDFSLRFDDFLHAKNRDAQIPNVSLDFDTMADWANDYANVVLNSEIEYFEDCNQKDHPTLDITTVINELETLLDILPKKGDNSHFLMRMGWGSGYKNITGNLLSQDQLNDRSQWNPKERRNESIRQKYRLATERLNFPFSKTRRIVFEGDAPSTVCGWVKISQV